MTDDTPEGKPFTGWPPGLLQDDSRGLFDWLASRIDAAAHVRDVCGEQRVGLAPKNLDGAACAHRKDTVEC